MVRDHVLLRLLAVCFFLFTLCGKSVAAQEVRLQSSDGFVTYGDFVSAKGGKTGKAVVLLHMVKHDRESWEPLVEFLKDKGISSLAIDLRGHGQSKIGPDGSDYFARVVARDAALFNAMHLDAEAGVRFLLEQGFEPEHIGLVGASVGCSVAIDTTVRGKVPVQAVVVMTPGANYLDVPTLEHVKHWPGRPLLILSSHQEKERGASQIYQRLKDKGATLELFDEEGIHGTYMFDEVDGVEQLITDWLAEKL